MFSVSTPRRRSLASLWVALTGLGLVSCAAILGFEPLNDRELADAADAPETTAPDSGVDGAVTCGLGEPPQAPVGVGGHLFALSALTFETRAPDERAAFNLDCADTQDPAQSLCKITSNLERQIEREAVRDDVGGVDNTFGTVFSALQKPLKFDDLGYSKRLASMILELSAVTLPQDSNVVLVNARPAARKDLSGTDAGDSCVPWPEPAVLPDDAGADGGYRDESDYEDNWCSDNNIKDSSREGWVEGGGTLLKARFPLLHVPFKPADPPLDDDRFGHVLSYMTVHDAVLVARVMRGADGHWRLEGHIAGSWNVDEFVEQFIRIKQCAGLDTGDVRGYLPLLCGVRDMQVGGGGAQAPCDSLSVLLSFRAYEVRQSTSRPAETYDTCADAAVNANPDAAVIVPTCAEVTGFAGDAGASSSSGGSTSSSGEPGPNSSSGAPPVDGGGGETDGAPGDLGDGGPGSDG